MPELVDGPRLEDGDALGRLAEHLRALRTSADGGQGLSYRKLAERARFSAPVLNKAANGRALPTWEVVCGFVAGCGADPADYRDLWQQARDEAGKRASRREGPAEPVDPAVGSEGTAAALSDGDRAAVTSALRQWWPPRWGRSCPSAPDRSEKPRRSAVTGPVGAMVAGVLVLAIASVVVVRESSGRVSESSTSPSAGPFAATLQPVSRPSLHCSYYYHLVNGAWGGAAYGCTANATGNRPYQAWIVCHDDIDNVDKKITGPTVHKPMFSVVDCPSLSHPKMGGFNTI